MHGCGGDARSYAMMPHRKEGSLPLASANNIVQVWPQANQCWDFYKYTGEDFNTNDGIQPKFFKRILEKLVKPRDPLVNYEEQNEI